MKSNMYVKRPNKVEAVQVPKDAYAWLKQEDCPEWLKYQDVYCIEKYKAYRCKYSAPSLDLDHLYKWYNSFVFGPGDWIINDNGKLSVCNNTRFHQTFEKCEGELYA